MTHSDMESVCEHRAVPQGEISSGRREGAWKKDEMNERPWSLNPTHTLTLRGLDGHTCISHKNYITHLMYIHIICMFICMHVPLENPAATLLDSFPGDQSRQRHWPNSDQSDALAPTGMRTADRQVGWTTMGSEEEGDKREKWLVSGILGKYVYTHVISSVIVV